MDLLLVSPPVANIGQAAASISVLTAGLRARGFAVGQWDAAIDAFHWFFSREQLQSVRDALEVRSVEAPLRAAATRAAEGIEAAKRALQDPATVLDLEAMGRAFSVLEEAGHVLTSVCLGRAQHSYRSFEIQSAFRDWPSLSAALDDRIANPYLQWTEESALPRILGTGARAVGISVTYLSQVLPAFTMVRALKRRAPELRVALGGGFLTALGDEARRIPREVVPADAILLQDGESALEDWLGGVASPESTCTDLAAVPSPSWTADGLELTRYLVPRYAIPLPLTRGCHWGRCLYCNISAQTASSYRVRPVDRAIADVRHAMEETGSNWFDLPVDSFRPDHLHAFALEVIRQGLDLRWAAEILLHPQLTTAVIADLARSGCRCLRFGMESASPEVLTAMNKPRPPDLASRVLRDCRAQGIRTSTMCIVGFPTETLVQRMQTFDFLVDHRDAIDFVALHEFNLVPGSPMAADPARHGLIVLPQRALLQPALPYRNTNQVGLGADQVHDAASEMRDALREFYPSIGKPWAVAIGGWLTFAWCCAQRP